MLIFKRLEIRFIVQIRHIILHKRPAALCELAEHLAHVFALLTGYLGSGRQSSDLFAERFKHHGHLVQAQALIVVLVILIEQAAPVQCQSVPGLD